MSEAKSDADQSAMGRVVIRDGTGEQPTETATLSGQAADLVGCVLFVANLGFVVLFYMGGLNPNIAILNAFALGTLLHGFLTGWEEFHSRP